MVSLLPLVIETPTPAVPVQVFGGSGGAGACANATEERSTHNPVITVAATFEPVALVTKFIIENHSSGA
jgi:hypothetical protein